MSSQRVAGFDDVIELDSGIKQDFHQFLDLDFAFLHACKSEVAYMH